LLQPSAHANIFSGATSGPPRPAHDQSLAQPRHKAACPQIDQGRSPPLGFRVAFQLLETGPGELTPARWRAKNRRHRALPRRGTARMRNTMLPSHCRPSNRHLVAIVDASTRPRIAITGAGA